MLFKKTKKKKKKKKKEKEKKEKKEKNSMVNKNEKYGLWFSLLEMKNVIAKVYLSVLVFKEIHLTFLDKCLLIIKQGNLFLGHIVANIEAVLYHARWPCDPLLTRERHTMMTAEGPCKAFVFLERERERDRSRKRWPLVKLWVMSRLEM